MAVSTARFEFRLRADAKHRIEQAAALLNQSASDFARTAAEERAAQVLHEHLIATVVPTGFFDDLLAALDNPPNPNEALRAAARRAADTVEWR